MSDTGNPDFQQHVDTWRHFTRLLTGSVIAIVVVLIAMALTLT